MADLKELFSKSTQKHWNHDIIAGFSVSLVALPLALGIALASGAPAYAGIISAIIGGIVLTFISGTHLVINGPGAGLIVITLGAVNSLDNGDGKAFQYVLAAYIISGIILTLFGIFKLGKYSKIFPSTVIQGLLAAIGIIIMIKQLHVSLDVTSEAAHTLDAIVELPSLLKDLNPFTTFIALVSLLILSFHHKFKNKLIHYIPSVIWVVFIAVLLVYAFDFFTKNTITILGKTYHTGPHLLIQVPENLFKGLLFPDFSQIHRGVFWMAVINITIISSIENVLSASAIEKMDPLRRKTKFNKDLISAGIGTILAASIGGLPAYSVISRSSVNVNHGARTKMSNLYHGIFLILFILIFPGIIGKLPLAALAGILVYTGYKLASPKLFREISMLGWEQFIVFIGSIIFTLWFGLLFGILAGMGIILIIHYYKIDIGLLPFLNYITNPFVKIIEENNRKIVVKIKGVANFLNIMSLDKVIHSIKPRMLVIADFTHARLVDNTTLEFIHEFSERYSTRGGKFEIIGLEVLRNTSYHPLGLHHQEKPHKTRMKLSKRQSEIKNIASEYGLAFSPEINWDVSDLKEFLFFRTRPVEYKRNRINGRYETHNVEWEFCDITFDEGALIAREVYHTSVEILKLPFNLPVFSLEKEVLLDKVIQLAANEDIDFKGQSRFSKRYLLKGPNKGEIRNFFTQELIDFFNKGEIYHLESNGKSLLVFRQMRLATPNEIRKMMRFSQYLTERLFANLKEI